MNDRVDSGAGAQAEGEWPVFQSLDAAADAQRELFRAAIAGRSHRSIATLSGGKMSHATISGYLRGRAQWLSPGIVDQLRTIPGLADVFSIDLIYNPYRDKPLPVRLPPMAIHPEIKPLTVRYEALAGVYRRRAELDEPRQQIYPLISAADHQRGAFAVRVRQPGAEKLYPDGSYLACIPPEQCRAEEFRTGRAVILQQSEAGAGMMITVRRLDLQPSEAWLWPRSTHPAHQVPVPMPYVMDRLPQPWKRDGVRYAIAGLVIWAEIPQR